MVIILHIGFFILESLLWTSTNVMKLFQNTEEAALVTKVLALNQGFYNLGAALILLWFQLTGNTHGLYAILIFLACMGVVGGLSANKAILLVQSLPATLALIALYYQA